MSKNQTLFNILFYIGYFCMVVNSMFYRVIGFERVAFFLTLISYASLCFLILLSFNKIKKRNIPFVLFAIIVCLISSRLSGDYLPLKFIFVILASKNVQFDKLVKNDLMIRMLLVLVVVSLHFIGLTNDYILYRSDGTIRNSMGFSHPNVFSFHLLIICLECFYLKHISNSKVKIKEYVFLAILLYIMNVFTDSRSSMIALILFGFLFLVKNKLFNLCSKHKSVLFVIGYLFLALSIISLVGTMMYSSSNSFLLYLNRITSYRLYYSNYFYKTYGLSILGQKVITISTEYARLKGVNALVLDNVYIHLLVRYGLCVYFVFASLFIKGTYYSYKMKNMHLFIVLITLVIFGLMESSILIIEICPFLIYFNNIIYNEEVSDNGK